jgi:hypothetical protein
MAYSWTQASPATPYTTIPSQNVGLIAYDTIRNRMILWGYTTSASWPNAATGQRLITWEYYAGNWHSVATANAPTLTGTQPFGMCFDRARGEVVLFVNTGTRQTWTYNGSNWTLKTPAHVPSVIVTGANLTYDVANGVCVLLGSDSGSVMRTWTWNGSDWTQIVTATAMTPWRSDFGFAHYDPGGYCLQFGGSAGATETWKLDVAANTWTHLTPATTPTGTGLMYLTYDPALGKLVGHNSTKTWLWDGSNWTDAAPSPDIATRTWSPIAYDAEVGQTMLVGAAGSPLVPETWFFTGPQVAAPFVPQIYRRL